MFGLGTGELLVVLVIVLLVFGASRLPELGKGLGQGMRSFKDALKNDEKLPVDPAVKAPEQPPKSS
jgi:sec-independent protein translocase protein TatA